MDSNCVQQSKMIYIGREGLESFKWQARAHEWQRAAQHLTGRASHRKVRAPPRRTGDAMPDEAGRNILHTPRRLLSSRSNTRIDDMTAACWCRFVS
jgi:hypothetical protein